MPLPPTLLPALVLGLALAPPAASGGDDTRDYGTLLKLYRDVFRAVLVEADNGERATALFRDASDPGTASRFIELHRLRRGDPDAVEALVWIGKFSPWPPTLPQTPEAEEARRALAEDHAHDPRIDHVLPGALAVASGSEAAERLYRRVYAEHPDRDVRGRACYWLARYLEEQADWARQLRWAAENPTADEAAAILALAAKRWGADAARRLQGLDPAGLLEEAEGLYEEASRRYGDVMAYGYSDEIGPIGDASRATLDALRRLAVGREAPEIEGEDADGERFRLSDHRGKVVVLTFSGNWCPPCRAMYPEERALVERLEGKPFALLSVNTDEDVATLQGAIAAGEITWRCWWDGGTSGPICTAWHVDAFPTIYVIDRDGVIRDKDLRGTDLEAAVERLLDVGPPAGGG